MKPPRIALSRRSRTAQSGVQDHPKVTDGRKALRGSQRRVWLAIATSVIPGRIVQVLAAISFLVAAAVALSGDWPRALLNLAGGAVEWLIGWWMVRDARKRKALAAELDELAKAAARLLAAQTARQRIDLQRRNARWS